MAPKSISNQTFKNKPSLRFLRKLIIIHFTFEYELIDHII